MDHSRYDSCDHTLHAVLRSAVFVGSHAFAHHEGVGALARIVAADLWLRHFPLSADGCGSDFQARHGVYAGGSGHRGDVLRGRGRYGGAFPYAVPSSGPYGLMLAIVVTALLFDPV